LILEFYAPARFRLPEEDFGFLVVETMVEMLNAALSRVIELNGMTVHVLRFRHKNQYNSSIPGRRGQGKAPQYGTKEIS
jgi:hypothetical protein